MGNCMELQGPRSRDYAGKQWEKQLDGQDLSLWIKELELNSICKRL